MYTKAHRTRLFDGPENVSGLGTQGFLETSSTRTVSVSSKDPRIGKKCLSRQCSHWCYVADTVAGMVLRSSQLPRGSAWVANGHGIHGGT